MATREETVKTENKNKKLLTTLEAANYLGIDYAYFRRCRNRGYFGRDKYPAPKFINIGDSEKGIRYRIEDLDEWLKNYPSYTIPALFFKNTIGNSMNKNRQAA